LWIALAKMSSRVSQCSSPHLDLLFDSHPSSRTPHYAMALEPLNEIDLMIEKCVKVKPGISSQYIYRSLYAPQIYHCLKVSMRRPSCLSSLHYSSLVPPKRAISFPHKRIIERNQTLRFHDKGSSCFLSLSPSLWLTLVFKDLGISADPTESSFHSEASNLLSPTLFPSQRQRRRQPIHSADTRLLKPNLPRFSSLPSPSLSRSLMTMTRYRLQILRITLAGDCRVLTLPCLLSLGNSFKDFFVL
jgi:hypothetical protein